MYRAKYSRHLTICVLAGVEDVHVDGDLVVGRWKSNLTPLDYSRQTRLAEQFLNWQSDPKSIVVFTQKYGPIKEWPRKGHPFQFRVDGWSKIQESLQRFWETRGSISEWEITRAGGSLAYRNKKLIYTAPTLFDLLALEIVTCPVERRRKCARPDCQNPYFFAKHLRQNFCSDQCGVWGQRQSKLKWWREHGDELRRMRRTKRPRKES